MYEILRIQNHLWKCLLFEVVYLIKCFLAAHSKFSASLYYRTIKAAFNKAVIWNYINENPFNKIKAPKTSQSLPAYLTYEELQIIISNTEKEFLKPLFYTAFFTGMRLGELVNMKWHWIDFQNNIITVKCDVSFTTKNKKERLINRIERKWKCKEEVS